MREPDFDPRYAEPVRQSTLFAASDLPLGSTVTDRKRAAIAKANGESNG